MKTPDKTASKPSEDAPSSKAGGPIAYSIKALSTAVGGGLLSLAVAGTQMWYSDHLESKRRQADHGFEFQRSLFELSGQIENELRRQWLLLDEGKFEEANARMERQFTPLWEQWRLARLLLRNRGAQIYGDGVGSRIYDTRDLRFVFDRCSVLVHYDDLDAPGDCAPRVRERVARLQTFIRGVLRSGQLRMFDASRSWLPTSFHASAENARIMSIGVSACVKAAKANPGQCSDLTRLLGQHVQLVRFSRDNLADAIAARSSLND